jgi:signal transduction histidine kinase
LSARLLKIQEEERRNLAHELHDEIGQSITAQKIVLQTLCIGQKNSTFCDQIAAVIRITDTVLNQVRRISLDLRPAQLDDLGLPAAIRWNLMRQSRLAGFVPHFSAMDVPAVLPESIAIACYRISQEALTNAIRHGHAQNVWLSLKGGCAELQLEIRDDGEGFDPLLLEVGESMGMIGMQERAILANGQLAVCAQPGAGCMIVAKFAL